MMNEKRQLIIGVGNDYRKDDAAGLIVARKLRPLVSESSTVIEHSGEGVGLLEILRQAERVFIIDAVRSDAAPGSIFRFAAHEQPLPTKFFNYSTHAFSLAEAIAMAHALRQLPSRLLVYGIEGENFSAGLGLSPQVEQAVAEVVERIVGEHAD